MYDFASQQERPIICGTPGCLSLIHRKCLDFCPGCEVFGHDRPGQNWDELPTRNTSRLPYFEIKVCPKKVDLFLLSVLLIPMAMLLHGCSGDNEESNGIILAVTAMYTILCVSLGAYLSKRCCPLRLTPPVQTKKEDSQKPKSEIKKDTSQIAEIKVKSFFEKMTVDILQAMLKRVHAPVTGIKPDLVKRVLEEVQAVRLKKDD